MASVSVYSAMALLDQVSWTNIWSINRAACILTHCLPGGSGKTYTMGTDVGDLTTSVTVDGVMPEQV